MLISKAIVIWYMVLNGLVKFEFYLYIHMAGHELIWDALIKLRRDQRLKCSLAKIRIRINNLAWHLGMAGQLRFFFSLCSFLPTIIFHVQVRHGLMVSFCFYICLVRTFITT